MNKETSEGLGACRTPKSDRLLGALCALASSLHAHANPVLPMSLNFQNMEVRAALHALAEYSGTNMVIADSVSGRINLRLHNVSWQQALEQILQLHNLEQQVTGQVIRIGRRDEWLAQDKQRFDAGQQRRGMQPYAVATFVLRHRQANEVKKLLEDGHVLSERGSLLADNASNTLQVNDSAQAIARIRELLEQTDTPLRQVLIEARIVEASDNFSKSLGVKLNFASVKTQDQRPIRAAPRQENHRDSTNNSLAHSGISQPINSSYATIAALFRPSAGRLIELELLAMQAEDRGQVISNPRLLATDQSEATIEEGSEIPYSHTSRRGAMSTSFKKAALSLRIKPRIASDMSSIWLDVEISKDSPNYHHLNYSGAPSVDTKRIHTQVQIENGGTVVLGGIFIDEQNQQETKVPLLGDIPVLGWLFRSRHTRQQRRELLVFITPKIISNP